MKKINEEVNNVLAEWNPLNVSEYLKKDEYKAYIPRIIKNIQSGALLKSCLEDILINHLDVEYDSSNPDHLKDLNNVIIKLQKITVDSDKI